MLRGDRFCRHPVGAPARGEQPLHRRRRLRQPFDHIVETERRRHVQRRDVVIEHPAIDVAAAIRRHIAHRHAVLTTWQVVLAVPRPMVERLGIVT